MFTQVKQMLSFEGVKTNMWKLLFLNKLLFSSLAVLKVHGIYKYSRQLSKLCNYLLWNCFHDFRYRQDIKCTVPLNLTISRTVLNFRKIVLAGACYNHIIIGEIVYFLQTTDSAVPLHQLWPPSGSCPYRVSCL